MLTLYKRFTEISEENFNILKYLMIYYQFDNTLLFNDHKIYQVGSRSGSDPYYLYVINWHYGPATLVP
jgi:hypothetical protein